MRLGFPKAHKGLAVCSGAHGGDFSGSWSLERVPWPGEDVGCVLRGPVGLCDVDDERLGWEDGIGFSWRLRDGAGCGGGLAHGLQVL